MPEPSFSAASREELRELRAGADPRSARPAQLPEMSQDSASLLADAWLARSGSKSSRVGRFRLLPSLDLSLTGAVFIGMMLFMGLAAINSQANLLFGVFGLMIGILIVSGVISRVVLRRVTVRRELPEHGVVGTVMRATYVITNRKSFWPSLSISVTELDGADGFAVQPQCYMLHAAAGMSAYVPVDLLPRRRGLHELRRMQLSTSFPFGFIKRARLRERVDHVLIYPALARVHPRLFANCRPAEDSGPNMRPRPGGMDEFYGVKEYRPGDSPRWIYWRRSARTGTLVSREMTEVAPPRVVVLLDTHVASASLEEAALVERTIAMASSVAASGLDQGLSIGLFVWSSSWVCIQPMRGKQQRSDVLSALARLPVNTEHDFHELLDRCHPMLRSGTTPIMFTARPVQMGVRESGRGGMLVVSASTAEGRELFSFAPTVDFNHSMPVNQEPRERLAGARARHQDVTPGEQSTVSPVG